jgi:hypothetical protein
MKSTVEKKVITPEIAFSLLQSDHEYQRPLKRKWVSFLAKEMTAGNFVTNTIGICEDSDGKKYLVNGQHTLSAIFESGVTLELPVETFFINNSEDVASIYSVVDKQKKRTRADTLRAYKLEEKLDLPYTFINSFSTSAYFILNNFRGQSGVGLITDKEVVEFMVEWSEFAKKYYRSIEHCNTQRHSFMRKDIMSIGIITSRYSSKSHEFWSLTSTDDGLRLGDPRKTLRRWIEDVGYSGTGGSTAKKRLVGTQTAVRCVAIAWNAYVEGRETRILSVKNPSLPFSIKESPFVNIS